MTKPLTYTLKTGQHGPFISIRMDADGEYEGSTDPYILNSELNEFGLDSLKEIVINLEGVINEKLEYYHFGFESSGIWCYNKGKSYYGEKYPDKEVIITYNYSEDIAITELKIEQILKIMTDYRDYVVAWEKETGISKDEAKRKYLKEQSEQIQKKRDLKSQKNKELKNIKDIKYTFNVDRLGPFIDLRIPGLDKDIELNLCVNLAFMNLDMLSDIIYGLKDVIRGKNDNYRFGYKSTFIWCNNKEKSHELKKYSGNEVIIEYDNGNSFVITGHNTSQILQMIIDYRDYVVNWEKKSGISKKENYQNLLEKIREERILKNRTILYNNKESINKIEYRFKSDETGPFIDISIPGIDQEVVSDIFGGLNFFNMFQLKESVRKLKEVLSGTLDCYKLNYEIYCYNKGKSYYGKKYPGSEVTIEDDTLKNVIITNYTIEQILKMMIDYRDYVADWEKRTSNIKENYINRVAIIEFNRICDIRSKKNEYILSTINTDDKRYIKPLIYSFKVSNIGPYIDLYISGTDDKTEGDVSISLGRFDLDMLKESVIKLEQVYTGTLNYYILGHELAVIRCNNKRNHENLERYPAYEITIQDHYGEDFITTDCTVKQVLQMMRDYRDYVADWEKKTGMTKKEVYQNKLGEIQKISKVRDNKRLLCFVGD